MDPRLTEVTPVPGGLAIRKFTDQAIQDAVSKALNDIPDGKKGAVVAYADTTGAKLALMARLDDHWSVAMIGNYDWATHERAAGAEVRFTW